MSDIKEYQSAVNVIKTAILQSQARAAKAVNQEQLALYYGIGRYVSANTRKKNWGQGAIEAISNQLKLELPGLRGFSVRNIKNMRIFYEGWSMLERPNSAVTTAKFTEINSNSSVQTDELTNISAVRTAELTDESEIRSLQRINLSDFPVVAFLSISFTHHIAILSHVKTYEGRKFYIQYAADYKIKTEDLEALMEYDLYGHQGELPNNFRKTIPSNLQAYRAISMFKDEYLLDFINTEELFVREKDRDERVIEQGIIQNVKDFIMTFGRDFTFVGNQYHLEKFANKKFVEYVIQDYDKPMGVATYKTSADMNEKMKKLLPPVEELEKLL